MLDFLFKKKNNLTTDKSERLNKIYTCLKNKYPSDNISDDRKTELKNLITKYGYLPYPYIKALEELTNEEKGSAVYYGKTSFEIKANNMTYVNMEVPMINFGVSLSLPEGFTTVFPQYAFSVTVGKRTVSLKDGETAYFPYSEGGLSVSYTLSATNTDGEDNDKEGNNSSWEGKSTIQPNTVYVITYDYGTKSLVLVP